jgi:putative membrane protein
VTFSWSSPTFHLGPWLLAAGLGIWFFEATSHEEFRSTNRQRWAFGMGLVALVVALSWPVADLATSVSLLATIVQRQLLILAVAPLLLLGTPATVTARLTRPAAVDAVVRRLARPVAALVTTTVLLAITSLPASVDASASSGPFRALVLAGVLAAGIVLWIPVIDRVPGVVHLRPIVKAGYLVAQAVAPTFLSFIWIFSLHPLYHSLHGQRAALGISALTDQQLSGYAAKLLTFGVLLSVAYAIFVRGDEDDDEQDAPLRWIDVERALERADRQERRQRTPRDLG